MTRFCYHCIHADESCKKEPCQSCVHDPYHASYIPKQKDSPSKMDIFKFEKIYHTVQFMNKLLTGGFGEQTTEIIKHLEL